MKNIFRFALLILLIGFSLQGQVKMTPENVLKKYFQGLKTEKMRVYIKNEDKESLEQQLGEPLPSRFYTFYTAKKNGRIEGYALFDTHQVRTKEETICIILDFKGNVKFIELVSFYEPDEYAAPVRWLAKFIGVNETTVKDVQGMTGATLTSRAIIRSVHKALVVFRHTLAKQ